MPVLVVKAGASSSWNLGPKNILICLDGSELANSAISYGLKLAKDFGSNVTLLRCVSFTPASHPSLQPIISAELIRAEDFLVEIRDRHQNLSISVETRAVKPEEGILELAERSDLVVMSSHGRTGLKRWLMGSVAENIVQLSPCPVLIIHPTDT